MSDRNPALWLLMGFAESCSSLGWAFIHFDLSAPGFRPNLENRITAFMGWQPDAGPAANDPQEPPCPTRS